MAGPLTDLRVVEIAALGPAPHAAMLLAQQGADVVRVTRPISAGSEIDGLDLGSLMTAGKRSVTLDVKRPEDLEILRELIARADVLIEGMRPGVAERLGIGPEPCLADNPGLVYARMTGWGQSGPLAVRAGHDINYLALSGVLHLLGHEGSPPSPPLNLLADFGGGSMFLLFGILSALYERQRSGRGQVVDAAMVDGVGSLAAMTWEMTDNGAWAGAPGENLLDGGAPFYTTYPCRDGRFVAVGPLEAPFFAQLLQGLGLEQDQLPAQYDRAGWPQLREEIGAALASRSRDEWAAVFDGTDACVTPVLTRAEALEHVQIRGRSTPGTDPVDGVTAARRASGHPDLPDPAPCPSSSASAVIQAWSRA